MVPRGPTTNGAHPPTPSPPQLLMKLPAHCFLSQNGMRLPYSLALQEREVAGEQVLPARSRGASCKKGAGLLHKWTWPITLCLLLCTLALKAISQINTLVCGKLALIECVKGFGTEKVCDKLHSKPQPWIKYLRTSSNRENGWRKKERNKRKEPKQLAKAQMNHETLRGLPKSKTLLGTIY